MFFWGCPPRTELRGSIAGARRGGVGWHGSLRGQRASSHPGPQSLLVLKLTHAVWAPLPTAALELNECRDLRSRTYRYRGRTAVRGYGPLRSSTVPPAPASPLSRRPLGAPFRSLVRFCVFTVGPPPFQPFRQTHLTRPPPTHFPGFRLTHVGFLPYISDLEHQHRNMEVLPPSLRCGRVPACPHPLCRGARGVEARIGADRPLEQSLIRLGDYPEIGDLRPVSRASRTVLQLIKGALAVLLQ